MKRVLLLIVLFISLVARVWDLSSVPNGFSWDELDNVYQAYSLLKTGRDIFGNALPVLLHSLADYKSSLYIYMTVPFVAVGGMNILTAKAAAIIFGVISIASIGIIAARKFKSINLGIVAGIVMAITPWWFNYSRLSFEAVGMMAFFLLGLAHFSKKPVMSIIMFALSVWTYSTAKMFTPIFVLLLFISNWKWLGIKKVLLLGLLFGTLVMPVQWQTFFGKGGTRFNEISVFTDPTTATEINYLRELSQVSSGVTRTVGLSPRFIDKLANNKITFWGSKIFANYLQAFSTEFLFIKGDPNLRHSPGIKNIGQLHLTDFIFLAAGLVWLVKRPNHLIGWWLILAPLPSVITRDGGTHATRLLFMLPPLVLIITAGINEFTKNKLVLFAILGLHILAVAGFGYYYFSNYRFESAKPFHWGYEQVIEKGLEFRSEYSNIVFDFGNESALMAYLVHTNYDPRLLQAKHPLSQENVISGYSGIKFDGVTIMTPGYRTWDELPIQSSTLLIMAADLKVPKTPRSTIEYPNKDNAFYFIGY